MAKSFLSNIFFSLLVLALGAWAFYEYRKSRTEEEREIQESVFFQKKLEELKSFRIQTEDTDLELVEEGKNWLVKSPIEDLADFSEVSRWFDEIQNQKVQKIEIDGEIPWEEYYLDQSPSVEIHFKSGESLSFRVSRKSSFDGKHFIRKGGELFLGELYFASEVNNKDWTSFRNKKIWPSAGHAREIQYKGKDRFTLQWKDYEWSLDEKSKPLPLNSDRLDGFWTDASSLKASEIKEKVSASVLKKYGLHRPQVEMVLKYVSEDRNSTVKISPVKEDKAFVVVSHRDFVFEFSKEDIEKLILSFQEIRDHNFPFKYKMDSAFQIERQNSEEKISLKKEKELWTSLDQGKGDVDSGELSEFLDQIQSLEGTKYRKGEAEKPKRYLHIKDSEGNTFFELKEAYSSKSHSWVKTNLWNELVAVKKTDMDAVFDKNLFSDAEPAEE